MRKAVPACIVAFFAVWIQAARSEILINEIDTDQTGIDAAEFVELFNTDGSSEVDLAAGGYVLVLYNGNDNASYRAAIDLTGLIAARGYYVIGTAGVVPAADQQALPDTNWIQNGADAVALYRGTAAGDFDANDHPVTLTPPGATLVDALVYDTDDADDGTLLDALNAAGGQINEDGRNAKDTHSNARAPDGAGGGLVTSFYTQRPPTPGTSNGAPTPPPEPTPVTPTPTPPPSFFDYTAPTYATFATQADLVAIGGGLTTALDGFMAICIEVDIDGSLLALIEEAPANGSTSSGTSLDGALIDLEGGGLGTLIATETELATAVDDGDLNGNAMEVASDGTIYISEFGGRLDDVIAVAGRTGPLISHLGSDGGIASLVLDEPAGRLLFWSENDFGGTAELRALPLRGGFSVGLLTQGALAAASEALGVGRGVYLRFVDPGNPMELVFPDDDLSAIGPGGGDQILRVSNLDSSPTIRVAFATSFFPSAPGYSNFVVAPDGTSIGWQRAPASEDDVGLYIIPPQAAAPIVLTDDEIAAGLGVAGVQARNTDMLAVVETSSAMVLYLADASNDRAIYTLSFARLAGPTPTMAPPPIQIFCETWDGIAPGTSHTDPSAPIDSDEGFAGIEGLNATPFSAVSIQAVQGVSGLSLRLQRSAFGLAGVSGPISIALGNSMKAPIGPIEPDRFTSITLEARFFIGAGTPTGAADFPSTGAEELAPFSTFNFTAGDGSGSDVLGSLPSSFGNAAAYSMLINNDVTSLGGQRARLNMAINDPAFGQLDATLGRAPVFRETFFLAGPGAGTPLNDPTLLAGHEYRVSVTFIAESFNVTRVQWTWEQMSAPTPTGGVASSSGQLTSMVSFPFNAPMNQVGLNLGSGFGSSLQSGH